MYVSVCVREKKIFEENIKLQMKKNKAGKVNRDRCGHQDVLFTVDWSEELPIR